MLVQPDRLDINGDDGYVIRPMLMTIVACRSSRHFNDTRYQIQEILVYSDNRANVAMAK